MTVDATTALAQELGKTLDFLYQSKLRHHFKKDVLYRNIRDSILAYNRAPTDDNIVKCSPHTVRQWFQGRSRPNSKRKRESLIRALDEIFQKKVGEPLDKATINTIRELCAPPDIEATVGSPRGTIFHNLPRKRSDYEVARRDLILPAQRHIEAPNPVPLIYLRGLRNSGTSVVLYQLCQRYLDPNGQNRTRAKPFQQIIYINGHHAPMPLLSLTTQLQEELTAEPVTATNRWSDGQLHRMLAETSTLIAIDDYCYQGANDPILEFLKELRYPSIALLATDCYFERGQTKSSVATVDVTPLPFDSVRLMATRYFESHHCQPKKMMKDEDLRKLYARIYGIPGLLVPLFQELCDGERTESLLQEPLLHFASFARQLDTMFQSGWSRITALSQLPIYMLLQGLRDNPGVTVQDELQVIVGLSNREFRDARHELLKILWLKETINDGVTQLEPHPLLYLFLQTVKIP